MRRNYSRRALRYETVEAEVVVEVHEIEFIAVARATIGWDFCWDIEGKIELHGLSGREVSQRVRSAIPPERWGNICVALYEAREMLG